MKEVVVVLGDSGGIRDGLVEYDKGEGWIRKIG